MGLKEGSQSLGWNSKKEYVGRHGEIEIGGHLNRFSKAAIIEAVCKRPFIPKRLCSGVVASPKCYAMPPPGQQIGQRESPRSGAENRKTSW